MDRLLDLKVLEDGETLLFPEPIAEGDAVTFDSRGVDVARVHGRGALRADDSGAHHAWITWESESHGKKKRTVLQLAISSMSCHFLKQMKKKKAKTQLKTISCSARASGDMVKAKWRQNV